MKKKKNHGPLPQPCPKGEVLRLGFLLVTFGILLGALRLLFLVLSVLHHLS
jgi:hypothetical protein